MTAIGLCRGLGTGKLSTQLIDDLAALLPYANPVSSTDLVYRLYREWYLRSAPPPARTGPVTPYEVDPVPSLQAAHAASTRFEPGWTAVRVSTAGRVQAVRGDELRLVGLGDYVDLSSPGRMATPGHQLAVTARRSSVENGFWVSRTAGWPRASEHLLTRLYVAVTAQGATTALALLTKTLERRRGDYAIKVYLSLGELQRADGLVVYLPRADAHDGTLQALAGPLLRLAAEGRLQPTNPRLTARLAAGVGVADGAAQGASFGQQRCELVAAALSAAGPNATIEAVCAAVGDAFVAAGLDASRPHLDPGAGREYEPLD